MATGADIPVPICETRGEQVGILVDNIINISVSKLSLEKHTRDDQFNEHPTVEGESFLIPPSTGEVHREVNHVSPSVSDVTEEPDQAVKDSAGALLPHSKLEDQPIEAATNEEISAVEIQQNGEESNSTEKDGDSGTDSSVVTSEMKVGDKLEDGDARVVTQLSDDTCSSLTEYFETSNHNELQSKSDLESTLSDSHGDEDDATDHSIPSLAEKSEEISLVQVKDSKTERDEHLEEESERLPSTKVSTWDTNDSIPPATHNVKDNDEDIIEAELSENEPGTRCLSVEEDGQIEVPNLSQKNNIQENKFEAEEATIDAVDRQKESLESCSSIASSSPKEGSMNTVLQEATSDHLEVLENLSVGEAHTEINNVAPDLSGVTEESDQTVRDGIDTLHLVPKLDDQKVELAANEDMSMEEIQLNAEKSNSTEKDGDGGAVSEEQCSTDSSVMTSEVKAGDTTDVDDARVVSQLSKDTSINQHGTNDSSTKNIALTKEILEETNIPSEETESLTPGFKEGEKLIVQVKTADNKSEDKKTSEVSKEGESEQNKTTSEQEVLANEIVAENYNTAAGETSQDDSASKETARTLELQSRSESNSSLSKDEETTVEKVDCTLTADKSEESSLVLIEDSKIDCDGHLEEEGERLSLTEVSTGATSDTVPPVTDIASKETTTRLELQSKSESNSSLSKEEETPVEQGDMSLTAEKWEESSLAQIEDSEIECDEHLEKKSERLPLTEVSIGAADDSIPPVTNIAFKETTATLELQSKSESNSSLTKEEETTVEKGDSSLTAEESEESSLAQIEDSKIECDEHFEKEGEGERLPSPEVSTRAANDNVLPVRDIAFKETTATLELQSKSESNSSLSKEEETAVEKSESFLTAEKSEESSLAQIEDSNIECDEHLEKEGEKLPLTEVSTGATDDNIPPAKDIAYKETTTALELQNKSESNPSLTKEEETTVKKGDKSLKAERSEESSLAQIEDSKIECDEHLEKEGERLPLMELLTEATDDSIPLLTDIVEDKDEDLKDVKLPENEPGTRTSVKEDRQIETHAESLLVTPKDIEESNLSQENCIKGPPQEQSIDATLHGNINEVEEATIDAVDQQKECLESFPSIVSSSLDEGSMNAVLQEVVSDHIDEKTFDEADKHEEVPKNLTSEAHSEINNFAPDISEVTEKPDQTVTHGTDNTLLLVPKLDDQKGEFAANEEISVEEIQPNAEISNSTEKDGNGGAVSEDQCSTDSLVATSEVKAGETLDDLGLDDASVATRVTKDTSTENIPLAEEILEETNILIEETASQAPCNAEGEELNVQVKTVDNKSEDEKTTEEDKLCSLTSEVSKEGESDQNKTTSKQEVFTGERSVEDDSSTAGEEVSQENSAYTKSITRIETYDSNELQSNSNFTSSSSFPTEDETSERGDRFETTLEDYGVPLKNSLSENHGDIEWHSNTLEDAAADDSDSKLAEKSEESSLDNENVSEDVGAELKEVELFENEQSIGRTLVKEDMQIEHHVESLSVAAEGIEVSDLHQEKNIKGPLEEQSTNTDLHGNTIEADEATINDLVDRQKKSIEVDECNEVLEDKSLPTIVSTDDVEGSSLIKLDRSENQNEDDIGKEEEKVPLATEISDEPKLLHEAQFDGGELKKAEFCDTERYTESMLLNTESRTSNTEDSLNVTSEDNKAPDLSQEIETRTTIEEQDLSAHPQGILEKKLDSEIVGEAETKEDPLQNISNEDSNKDLLIDEDPNYDKSTILLEPKTVNDCLSTVELPDDEKSTDCTTPNKENLQDAPEDHITSTLSEANETTFSLEEQSLAENSQEIIGNTIIEADDKKELALENVATEFPHEHIEENSVTQVDCSERNHEEPVEKDYQNASLTEATIEESNARDWESRKIEEAKVEKPVDSLQVKPEDIKQHYSNLHINNSIEKKIQDTEPREISSDITEREPVDVVDTNEEIVEAKGIAKNNPDCDKDAASDEMSTKNTEDRLTKEEESIKLETNIEPPKGIETPLLGQDRETSCLDEQSVTANTEGDMDDNKEDIADNPTGSDDETPKDKENIGNTTIYEDKEENSQVQEDCSLKVCPTESSPVKEEEQLENSVEEEIITANLQETCNEIHEKIVDAADEKNEVVVNVPNGDNEGNSPTEMDGSQKPSSEEAPAEKIIDDESTDVYEVSSANEKTVKANLFEEEKIENALTKEEVATSSVQHGEASYLEEQAPITNSQETSADHKEGKMIQLADEKEEIVEDKNYATTPYKDSIEDSHIQVDGSLLEQKEYSEMDNESTSLTDAPKDIITESVSVREVATEDIKTFASCQDTEISSTEKQILDPEEISNNKIVEKTIAETSKETEEAQDIAKGVPHEAVSSNVEDGSQKAYLVEGSVGIIDEDESTTSQDEQILGAYPREVIDDNKTIDPIDLQKETPTDEVPKEIESDDVKATSIELKEEEGYLKDIQMTTAVNLVAAHQEKSSNLTACAEDLDVDKDIIGHIPEVRNDKLQEPSIVEVSENHVTISNDHVSDNNILEPEVSENNNDQFVGEANSCGDKTDSEKIEVSNDGYIAVPTNETLAETDPSGSTEAEVQVPNGEKDTELSIQEAEIDRKHVKETLLHNASECVSESEEVNGEEKTDSNYCNEISGSDNSVASQEVSTSNLPIEEDPTCNSSPEPRKETREETETEEPQKQDSEPQVSELIQDSAVENIEKDAQLFLASANDSSITEEVQKLQEVPLPAPNENITTDCKESDVVEGATIEDIDHPEQHDTIKSFSYDKNPIEEALEEEVANDILPVPLSETSKVDHSTTEGELTNREQPRTENTATGDDEKEACQEKISGISSTAPDLIQARDTDVTKSTDNSDNILDTTEVPMINENTSVECILVNERSVTELETKNDDEAPEIKETTPLSAEGQDVGENSNTPGSLTEEKSDSDEDSPGESKSGYESNNQMLESIAHVQSRDIISGTEERKIEEDNLKAEAEIKSVNAAADNTLEQEETTCEKEISKDDIPSEEHLLRGKTENEDIKDYDQGSCEEEVVRDCHQENEIKQEQKISKEVVEFVKDGSRTEMVSKVFEEAENKAPADREVKILTNEAIDKIFHQEEQEKGIEEPTTKIDNVAHDLAIASVNTDTGDSNKEDVHIAIIPGNESEGQNNKDEIYSSGEIQAKDEENTTLSKGKTNEEAKDTDTWTKPHEDEEKEAYIEAKKLDFASQTKGLSECTVIDGAIDTGEVSVQEAKAGIDLGVAAPKATGIESREVEEVNDKCAAMEDTSTPVEPPVISTSKIIPEWAVGTPLEAEDQQTELHNLQEELNIKDSEVQMAEKDDVINLQSSRDISKDVQELSKESFEVSNNENPVKGDPEEKIETSEGQETKPVQNAPVSETLDEETEEQQLGRGTDDVHEEQEKIDSIPNQLESTYGTEPSIPQSSVEDTAQHEKREGSQQIDSPPSLPQAQCSDIKTSEKDILVHVAGLDSGDVAELEATPLPLKYKNMVLEADDAKILNHENPGVNKNISTEFSQGEHEIVKPSKVEQEEAECSNEEREGKSEYPEPEETGKPSLSELVQVSMRGTTQMADHSATEKKPTSHTKDLRAENSDEAEHKNSKTDEEEDDEEESHEQQRSDSVSEAPVIVNMADAEVRVAHKKSHNILSGVGSKVKHSIAKVKKVITGKSSNPKPPSPKKVTS